MENCDRTSPSLSTLLLTILPASRCTFSLRRRAQWLRMQVQKTYPPRFKCCFITLQPCDPEQISLLLFAPVPHLYNDNDRNLPHQVILRMLIYLISFSQNCLKHKQYISICCILNITAFYTTAIQQHGLLYHQAFIHVLCLECLFPLLIFLMSIQTTGLGLNSIFSRKPHLSY